MRRDAASYREFNVRVEMMSKQCACYNCIKESIYRENPQFEQYRNSTPICLVEKKEDKVNPLADNNLIGEKNCSDG